jgi:hypothetical protein
MTGARIRTTALAVPDFRVAYGAGLATTVVAGASALLSVALAAAVES